MQLKTVQDLAKNHQNRQLYQNHFVNVKVYSMNWKVFLGFFALPLIRVLRIDCLKVADIVNSLNAGAKYPTFYNSKERNIKSLEAFFKWAISWGKSVEK